LHHHTNKSGRIASSYKQVSLMVNREPDFFSSTAEVVNLLTGIETDLSLPITSAKGLYMEINHSHI